MTRAKKKTALEQNRDRFTAWCDEVGVRAVARALVVAPSTASRIKNGLRNVSGELATKMQRLRGIPAVDWFE